MTREHFNKKYEQYLGKGHYGLSIDIPELTIMLDNMFSNSLIHIEGFEYHQIKAKFGQGRFYFTSKLNNNLEMRIGSLVETTMNYFLNKDVEPIRPKRDG